MSSRARWNFGIACAGSPPEARGESQIEVGDGVVGIKVDRLDERSAAVGRAPEGHERDSEVVLRLGVARFELQRALQMGQGVAGAVEQVERVTEVIFGLGVVGPKPESLFVVGQRLGGLARVGRGAIPRLLCAIQQEGFRARGGFVEREHVTIGLASAAR